jgi:hypothetical protein
MDETIMDETIIDAIIDEIIIYEIKIDKSHNFSPFKIIFSIITSNNNHNKFIKNHAVYFYGKD